ncbi:MAG: helix-turn-helix domain-containing protein [Lachnospiraceae bacterium]|nr:helix-turn-helix domain-containing protein [Lachnospiraceae bacterium]
MIEKREELNEQIETMKKLREEAGLNRREFSDYMGIPLRTLEEWEAGRRRMPNYVLRLITYYVRMQKYIMEKGITDKKIKEWEINDKETNG